MQVISVHDKAEIAAFLQPHRELNFYLLGDLEDAYWPYTHWYALKEGEAMQALALLYTGLDIPILQAFDYENPAAMRALLLEIQPLLPARFYTLLSAGLEASLQERFDLHPHGEHLKMRLHSPANLDAINTAGTFQLTPDDLEDLQTLYAASYPNHWFTPRMLEAGGYFGLRSQDGELIAVAGVHVYAPAYGLAALGNITTHPEQRGKGLGATVTAALCKQLLKTVDLIGLTVQSENPPALRMYAKLGFEVAAAYYEYTAESKGNSPASPFAYS